jgi:hypothetical protein
MSENRVHGAELRGLGRLLAAILIDPDLTGELSYIERESLEGACAVVRRLLPIVEVRDLNDALNES